MSVPQYLFTQDYIAGNAYYDGTNWRYSATRDAYLIELNSGVSILYAPSGTAGTIITWGPPVNLTTGLLNINSGYGTIPGIGGAAGGPGDLAIGGGGANPFGISMGFGDGSGYTFNWLSGLSGGTNIASLTDTGFFDVIRWIGIGVSSPSDASPLQQLDVAADGKIAGNLGISAAPDHTGTFALTVGGAIKASGLDITGGGTVTLPGIIDGSLSINQPVRSDGSKKLVSGALNLTTADVTQTGMTAGYFASWASGGLSEIAPGATASNYITGFATGSPTTTTVVQTVALSGTIPPGLTLTVGGVTVVTGYAVQSFNVSNGLVQ